MKHFRLQDKNDGSLKSGEGWFPSIPFGSTAINAISDPDGGKGADPTSIPTPFARMDLVRTAFKFVNAKQLDGNSNFHNIVSQALDVGEIFFNAGSFGQSISIIEWDKNQEIQRLKNSPTHEMQNFGQTLEMYLVQDAKSFNFQSTNKVFVLLYNNNVIGGTSPVSLFFSGPNDFSLLDIPLPGGNKAFKHTLSLYERDESYIRYLFAMRAFNITNFASLFPEVNEYLDNTLKEISKINPNFFNELNQLQNSDYQSDYVSFNNNVFILNNLPLKQNNGSLPKQESDYTLLSSKYSQSPKPLVLKTRHAGVDANGSPMRYWQGTFDPNTPVPYEDPEKIGNRSLPGLTGIKYPYITIGDFLEPYIIKTVFPIDKTKFHDGNYSGSESQSEISYLLPLKKEFFDYFDVADLDSNVGDGKNMLEMQQVSGNAIRVNLRIPIKKGFINYERTYYGGIDALDTPKPDLENNKGAIIQKRFDLAIFPFLRFNENTTAEYRIALVDGDNSRLNINNDLQLSFLKLAKKPFAVDVVHSRKRVEKELKVLSGVEHFVIQQNFDAICVEVAGTNIRGMIIPNFPVKPAGGNQYTFAVDLGTTYTHIEYRINGGAIQPFSIDKEDIQLVKLHDPQFDQLNAVFPEVLEIFDMEFIPEIIGKDEEYYFPIRTSLLEVNNITENDVKFSLVERNIPFVYEKRPHKNHMSVFSGLKWGQDQQTSQRAESFIETILLLIRNKVLMGNGVLENTKLFWFYPLSMMEGRKYQLESKWNKHFTHYITTNPERKPKAISESIAPFFYYYKSESAISYDKPVISVDIGGETTDVVIFNKNNPSLLTSFRFAADAVFGNPYQQLAADNNGFVKRFGKEVDNILKQHNLGTLGTAYQQIKSKQALKDIIAFYFSLEKNKGLKDNNIQILFNQWLAENEDFKIVFVLFYASVVYHIARITKAKGYPMPRYITFSGTGSKILNIICPNNSPIEELSGLIFQKVLGSKEEKESISILRNELTPKEISCKGGIMMDRDLTMDQKQLREILLGIPDNQLADSQHTYKTVSNEHFLREVEQEVLAFYDFFMEIFDKNEFDFSKLLVNTAKLSQYRELMKKDVYNFINEGLNLKRLEIESEDQAIEETLFFYAIKGSIHNLIKEISETNKE